MGFVCVVCNDLIFSTKIKGTAEALGIDLRIVPGGVFDPPEAPVDRILIDLNAPGTSSPDLARLRQVFPPPTTIVAFGSHVDVARLKAAREAGCDLVLPRSAFVEQLPTLLDPLQESKPTA
jgi:DNA-binding NarL/FixJ family response regulator